MKPRNSLSSIVLALISFMICANFANPLIGKTFAADHESELFLVAQKALDDGFYDVAIRYIQEYLEAYPQAKRRTEARLILGQCHFFKGQYLESFDIFRDLQQTDEWKDASLFWLAETYFKAKDYPQAQEHYLRLIDSYPDSTFLPQAYHSLGWTYFEQGQFQKAKETFMTFTQKFITSELAEDCFFMIGECDYQLRDYEAVIKDFRSYVLKFQKSNRHDQAYFYIGESYYYLEQYPDAIDYFLKAVAVSKNNELTLMAKISLGWSYLKQKEFDQAQIFFVEAKDLADKQNVPTDEILLGLATLDASMEEYSKALATYEELMREHPTSERIPQAHLGKANILYSLGQYNEAIQENIWMIQTYSSDKTLQEIVEKAYFGLAWIYLKRGEVDSAIENFQKVADQTQSKVIKVSALTQIGDTTQDNGQYAKAVEIYDKILKEYPQSLYADYIQYRQGVAFLKMDRIESAALVFQSHQSNFPESKYFNDVRYYLGLVYFKKNDWLAAKEELEAFCEALPKTHELQPEANYLIGLSLFNLNQTQEAMEVFQRITKNYPDKLPIARDAEVNIAKCLYRLGDDKEALKKFKIIVYKYPQTETALESLLWLGDYYLEHADYDNVILYFDELIKQFPDHEKANMAHYGLGQAYASKQELDLALSQYKMIDTNDREIYAKAQLAIADIFSRDIEPDKAVLAYQKIVNTSPEFVRDAYVKIAEINIQDRQYAKAIDAFRKALDADIGLSQFSDAQLTFLIGDTLEMLNQNTEALQTYLKIPYLYPEERSWATKAYLRMAKIFEEEEDWENAKLAYNKIIEQGVEEAKFAQERIEWINSNIELPQN
ncbi:MAG: tetratricopeptide repeat protein [Candidatus Omnitrophota bacterium]